MHMSGISRYTLIQGPIHFTQDLILRVDGWNICITKMRHKSNLSNTDIPPIYSKLCVLNR